MTIILLSILIAGTGAGLIGMGYYQAFRNNNPDGMELTEAGQRVVAGGYLYSVWRRRILRKLQLLQQEESFYRNIHINDNPNGRRLVRECRQGLLIGGLLLGFGCLLGVLGVRGTFSDTEIKSFVRPDRGTRLYHLRAAFNQENYYVDFKVGERVLTEKEVRGVWEEARNHLPEQMLAANRCAEEVTGKLYFPKKLAGTNVDLVWMPSDYKLVDYEGKVYPQNAEADGSIVIITVQVKYGGFIEFLDIPIRVCRLKDGTGDAEELLTEELMKYDTAQTNEYVMELPETVNGTKVVFYEKKSKTPWGILGLFLLLLIGVFALWESEGKRLRKEREDQLLRDYPDLVSKLTLLLQAGLTLRLAWDRITADYLSYGNGERRYVYEEMRNIRNRLNAGASEESAYEEFGRNCGNLRYLRLSSVLVQNLKKGTGGLIPLLRKEAAEAFADRKERVKQLGEEAGTKLLIPMAGILVLILAIIMIPAFLSF